MGANVLGITNQINQIKETVKLGNTVGATFATLVDLGTSLYRNLYIKNTCNQAISLRFTTPESTPVNYDIILDLTASSEIIILPNFYHNGVVGIKHNGTAPTSGQIKVWSF